MNLSGMVGAYLDELFRCNEISCSAGLVAALPDAGAMALSRLQARVTEAFLADGWQPPESEGAFEFAQSDTAGTDDGPKSAKPPMRPARIDHASSCDRIRRALSQASPQRDRPSQAESRAMRTEVTQLRQAMKSRAAIEQAKGILMAWHGITAERAWSYLVQVSNHGNVKLRAVAENVIGQAAQVRGREPVLSGSSHDE